MYVRALPQGQLVSIWQDLSQGDLSLNQQLSEFYDTLLSTWHCQLQWTSQVRRAPPTIMADTYSIERFTKSKLLLFVCTFTNRYSRTLTRW